MNTEERKTEILRMLAEFKTNGISHDPKRRLQSVLRWQDLIGQATTAEIQEIENGLGEDNKRLFLFANLQTLDPDAATSLFMQTIGRRKLLKQYEADEKDRQDQQAAIDARLLEVTRKEADFERSLEAHKAGIRNLESKLREATEAATASREAREEILRQYTEYRKNAEIEEKSAEDVIEALNARIRDFEGLKRILASLTKEAQQ